MNERERKQDERELRNILVQNKTHTTSFTFENKKNRLPLTVFWGLRHPKKTHGKPLAASICHLKKIHTNLLDRRTFCLTKFDS